MADHDLTELGRHAAADLLPTDAEFARLSDRLAAEFRVADELREAAPPRASRRRLVRMRRTGFATVLAGAAAVALVVAFGPGGGDGGHVPLPAPTSASAALLQAADAAGDVDWKPLGTGEYQHTFASGFTPDIPARATDPKAQIANFYRFPMNQGTESWLDRNGRGQTVDIFGGVGNPDLYPGIMRNHKTGEINGFGGYRTAAGKQVNNPPYGPTELQLRYPNWVTTTVRPRGSTPATFDTWYRQPKAFVRGSSGPYTRGDLPGGTNAEVAQLATWGATLDQLESLNELTGPQLRRAVAKVLLDDQSSQGEYGYYPRIGMYGITAASHAREVMVRRAVRLLGTAPLAPAARQELFRVLAAQPTAKLRANAKDELGRTGTRVTFETIDDRDVPASTTTFGALWKQAEFGPIPKGNALTTNSPIKIPAHHEFRRWYVDIIFDRTSGELLQQALYTRSKSSGRPPHVEQVYGARGVITGGRVRYQGDSLGETDSGVYVVRERATEIKPAAAVCVDNRYVCSGGAAAG